MTSLYLKVGAVLLVIALACAALFGAYHHGETLANDKWQAKWGERDAKDAEAKAAAELAARTLEQQREQSAEKVQRDATQKLEQARTDAAGANAAADGLRQRVQQLLAAGSAGSHPAATRSCPAGGNSASLFAELLNKSVERNRELAAVADTARVRGLACESAYGALVSRK